jgi:hypothetical protein
MLKITEEGGLQSLKNKADKALAEVDKALAA